MESTIVSLMSLKLHPYDSVPLYRQLYEQLRNIILNGQLPPGTKLPSTRGLSDELSIARNTVLNAYDQLLAEGYLKGRVGSGTYVASELPDELLQVRANANLSGISNRASRTLSRQGDLVARSSVSEPHDFAVPKAFRPGLMAMSVFPFKLWARLWGRQWRRRSLDLLGYGDPTGYRPLRLITAEYLKVARGIRCDADQIIVVAGSQQALTIATRVLLNEGDEVWMEDPGYPGAHAAFRGAGARVLPIPVDIQGLDIDHGVLHGDDAKLVYATPSHQYPLGVTMTLSRRLELLDWSRRSNAWILEDDYDSEFRYTGMPLAALKGLDTEGRVIYIGSFSKMLFPSLRLGYMVVPPDLVDTFAATRALIDRGSSSLDQAVLAEFISEGHFARYVRRARMLYAERQKTLVDAATDKLEGLLEVPPSDSGMHLVGWLPEGLDDLIAYKKAAQHNVEAPPLSVYYTESPERGGLLLGYTGVDTCEIKEGVNRLSHALESL